MTGPTASATSPPSIKARFGVDVGFADGSNAGEREAATRNADVIFSAGPAGVTTVTSEAIEGATGLLLAADANAVPPTGIEGVGATDKGTPLGGGKARAVGALTIGNVKYKTQLGLFQRMLAAEKTLALDFRDAYALALDVAG